MANYFYALSNSLVLGPSFGSVVPLVSGDTLTVGSNGYLVNFGINGAGVGLSNPALDFNASIHNLGLISGSGSGLTFSTNAGVFLSLNVINETTGTLYGDIQGIYAFSNQVNSSVTVVNHGSISGNARGIQATAKTITIDNDGQIVGQGVGIDIGQTGLVGAQTQITNSGKISGAFYSVIDVSGGSVAITNSGTLSGMIFSTAGGTQFNLDNTAGHIIGDVDVTSSGQDIFKGFGSTVTGNVSFNAGAGTLFDGTGAYIGGNVTLGNAADTVVGLAGGVVAGSLSTQAGNDIVDTTGGTVKGTIDLGAGADIFTGGDAIDKVVGGDGNDDIDLNGGNDIYYARGSTAASDGNDVVDGGIGVDTYVAQAVGTTGITIDLLDSIASGISFGTDHIFNFENATGTGNADVIIGTTGINLLNGGAGNDTINALAGNDRLVGGLGADTIIGGAGQDVMTGGAVTTGGDGFRDTFLFTSLADSGPAAGTRDWITDFTNGALATSDRINLVAIDANTALAGNQAFIWQAAAGAAFTGVKGQLHYAITGGNTYISGDVNGDKVADFSIALTGSHALAAIDFIL
jgi:RTX calcium-binding nonapeptide repeat (4 copies)